jgi:hypothetical protein
MDRSWIRDAVGGDEVFARLAGSKLASTGCSSAPACAKRLARAPSKPVRLTTSRRVLRAQQLPDRLGYTQHFQIFMLANADREQKAHSFLVAALVEQICTMLANTRTRMTVGSPTQLCALAQCSDAVPR